VPQNRSDLGQRRTRSEQFGRDGVPQPMRPDRRHSRAIARVTQHRPDRLHRQRSIWRERAHEHRTTPAVPTRITQGCDKGISDVTGKREPIRLATLAVDRQLPSVPVDVVQRQRGDLARAQPRRESSIKIA
jgi:hypothetical protein